MKLPADAGAVLVDLRPLPSHRQLVITIVILVGVGLLPVGDPELWPIPAFVGSIVVATLVLTMLVRIGLRRVVAVCEHGLAIRHGRTVTLVPWAQIRRIHSRRLARSHAEQIIVETDGASARFGFVPGQASSREQAQSTARAVAAIEQHTRLQCMRAKS